MRRTKLRSIYDTTTLESLSQVDRCLCNYELYASLRMRRTCIDLVRHQTRWVFNSRGRLPKPFCSLP